MPKLEKLTVSYSAKAKASLPGNRFENCEVSDVESRTYDVSDIAEDEVLTFSKMVREHMKERIDTYVQDGYNEIKDA